MAIHQCVMGVVRRVRTLGRLGSGEEARPHFRGTVSKEGSESKILGWRVCGYLGQGSKKYVISSRHDLLASKMCWEMDKFMMC